MSKNYPNPNPLTVDKIKPGLVFGWWAKTINEYVGKYELKAIDGYHDHFTVHRLGNEENVCHLQLLPGGTIEFYTSVAGAGLSAVKKPAEYCIIQEAPKEQPTNEN